MSNIAEPKFGACKIGKLLLQLFDYKRLMENERLRYGMHSDRATQFVKRLKWDINCDSSGCEVDEYDNDLAQYIVCVGPEDEHYGSLRLIPTENPNMIKDHFNHHFDIEVPQSDKIWEVTRFCVSPKSYGPRSSMTVNALKHGLRNFGRANDISEFVGLCFPAMLRIYRRIGWQPYRTIPSVFDQNLLLARWNLGYGALPDAGSEQEWRRLHS